MMCENPETLDTWSSVSRQHSIDTGYYLTVAETRAAENDVDFSIGVTP